MLLEIPLRNEAKEIERQKKLIRLFVEISQLKKQFQVDYSK